MMGCLIGKNWYKYIVQVFRQSLVHLFKALNTNHRLSFEILKFIEFINARHVKTSIPSEKTS